MPDISSLTGLKTTEPLDLPMYKTRAAARPFPKAGHYVARTPAEFPLERFGESQAGFMTVDVSPTLSGGDYDGYTINFTKVSAKTWTNKDGQAESQLGRYLKACGINETVDGEPQKQADLVEGTANTLLEIDIDWVARYNRQDIVKGMANFPKGEDGQPTRFVLLDGQNGRPEVKDPITGEPVSIRAYLEVTRFSPLTS